MRTTTRLRQLLAAPGLIVAPGAYDGFSARLIEAAGFSVVYMTGAGTAASHLGQPDLGLATLTEMAKHASHLASAVSLPVIADADTGYGNALNVVRTVREYEKAGVAGLHMEDQVAPKKCGHIAGKQVVPTKEFAEKIRAASEHRTDPDFLIIARTDARAVTSLDDAIDRGNRYAEAGADVIFVGSAPDAGRDPPGGPRGESPAPRQHGAGREDAARAHRPSWSGSGSGSSFPAVCMAAGKIDLEADPLPVRTPSPRACGRPPPCWEKEQRRTSRAMRWISSSLCGASTKIASAPASAWLPRSMASSRLVTAARQYEVGISGVSAAARTFSANSARRDDLLARDAALLGRHLVLDVQAGHARALDYWHGAHHVQRVTVLGVAESTAATRSSPGARHASPSP